MSRDRDFVLHTGSAEAKMFDDAIKAEIDRVWDEFKSTQKKIKPRSKDFIGDGKVSDE